MEDHQGMRGMWIESAEICFECVLDPSQCKQLRATLCDIIDDRAGSLRFCYLGNSYKSKMECFGTSLAYESEGVLLL